MTSGRFHLHDENDATANNAAATTALTTATTNTTTTASTSGATTTNNSQLSGAHDVLDNGPLEHIRTFTFSGSNSNSERVVEKLEIKIPELLQGGYSFYTWPSAPILAWFLWERRHALVNKRILEIGAGTALPGILAAKCGARVVLSDNCILPKSLAHTRNSCLRNNLIPGRDLEVLGLSWGLLLNSVFNLGPLDLIIGADCFYDPSVFEDIIVTVSFLLDRNPGCKFLFTYQERSADWSIEAQLKKWRLCAHQVNIDSIGKSAGIDLLDLMGGHTIHLIEINIRFNRKNMSGISRQVHKLFVGNLPWTVGHNELTKYFGKYGQLASATVIYDHESGFSKGYGFVAFTTDDALKTVLDEKVHHLEGRALNVQQTKAYK